MAGSNVVRELQSRGLVILGEGRSESTGDVTSERAEEGTDENLGSSAMSGDLIECLGAVNVKLDCLRTTFSFRRRVSKSRRFSFSFCACSFLASRSATLSSSCI